jgi:hypothetical protein
VQGLFQDAVQQNFMGAFQKEYSKIRFNLLGNPIIKSTILQKNSQKLKRRKDTSLVKNM